MFLERATTASAASVDSRFPRARASGVERWAPLPMMGEWRGKGRGERGGEWGRGGDGGGMSERVVADRERMRNRVPFKRYSTKKNKQMVKQQGEDLMKTWECLSGASDERSVARGQVRGNDWVNSRHSVLHWTSGWVGSVARHGPPPHWSFCCLKSFLFVTFMKQP